MSSSNDQSNEGLIRERQANLELPEDPPKKSDFNSSDASTQDVGYGGSRSSDMSRGGDAADGLRGPATGGSSVRDDGTLLKENTAGMNVGRVPGGTATDASSAGSGGTKETKNPDKGYPSNDSSSTTETRGPKETKLSSASEGPGIN